MDFVLATTVTKQVSR